MRTNIDIDDTLLKDAMDATGLPTKKAVVERALEELLREHRATQALRNLWGVGWDGDLDEIRTGLMPADQK